MVNSGTRAEVCIKSQQKENMDAQCAESGEDAGRAITCCPTKMLQGENKNLQLRGEKCAKPLNIQKGGM